MKIIIILALLLLVVAYIVTYRMARKAFRKLNKNHKANQVVFFRDDSKLTFDDIDWDAENRPYIN